MISPRIAISLRLLPLLLLAIPGIAADARSGGDLRILFNEGRRLYQEQDYESALQAFQGIVGAGMESSQVHFNIGNCFYKLGEPGRSILHYERALRLDPGDEDVQANLMLANQLIADRIQPLPRFWMARLADWWLHLLSPDSLIRCALACYLLAWSALIVRALAFRPNWSRWGLRLALVAGVLFAISGTTFLLSDADRHRRDEAIVLVEEVVVKSAPSDEAGLEVFSIHEGTKVRVDQWSGEWIEIVLADGKVGWIRLETVGVI